MQELNRNVTVTIGTNVTLISEEPSPAQRKVITIINTSTGGQTITLGIEQEAVAGQGIVLSPSGFYQESADAGFTPTNRRITAVSSAAGGTVAINERVVR